MGKATKAPKAQKENKTVVTVSPTPAAPMGVAAMAAAADAAELRIDANGMPLAVLAEIVGATRSVQGFMYMLPATAAALVQGQLVEQAPADQLAAGPNGELGTRATDAGLTYFDAAVAAEEAAKQAVAPPPSSPWGAPPVAAPTAPQILPDLTQTGQPAAVAAPAGPPKQRAASVPVDPSSVSKPVAITVIPPSKRGSGLVSRKSVYPFDSTPIGSGFFVAATAEKPEPWRTLTASVHQQSKKQTDESKFIVRHLPDGAAFGFPGKAGAGVYHVPKGFTG
jgi:hypothetical protein